MLREGQEVAQRARPDRRSQARGRDRVAGRERRAGGSERSVAGLDEGDHVALERAVDHGIVTQDADAPGRAGTGVVGHESHVVSSLSARAACATAASIRG